jgi:hypothetical protein
MKTARKCTPPRNGRAIVKLTGEARHGTSIERITETANFRRARDEPYCWQHKSVLREITKVFGESNQAASARSVYLALTELASDYQSERFTVNKALIAHKAGLSVKTVERLLHGLEEANFIRVQRELKPATGGAIKSPNTYTLLPMRQEGKPHSKSDKVERILKESKKESLEEITRKRDTRHSTCRGLSSLNQYNKLERKIIKMYHDILVASDPEWLPVNRFSGEVRNAIADWLEEFRGLSTDDLAELFSLARDRSDSVIYPSTQSLVRLLRENVNFR